MADIFKSATLQGSGHVWIMREIDGEKWRRAISPHNEAELDQYAPEIKPIDKRRILDKWATIPVPVPEPLPDPKTDAEVDAEMDAFMGNPFMLSVLEAVAVKLPGPVTVDELRGLAKTRGRINVPR